MVDSVVDAVFDPDIPIKSIGASSAACQVADGSLLLCVSPNHILRYCRVTNKRRDAIAATLESALPVASLFTVIMEYAMWDGNTHTHTTAIHSHLSLYTPFLPVLTRRLNMKTGTGRSCGDGGSFAPACYRRLSVSAHLSATQHMDPLDPTNGFYYGDDQSILHGSIRSGWIHFVTPIPASAPGPNDSRNAVSGIVCTCDGRTLIVTRYWQPAIEVITLDPGAQLQIGPAVSIPFKHLGSGVDKPGAIVFDRSPTNSAHDRFYRCV